MGLKDLYGIVLGVLRFFLDLWIFITESYGIFWD